METAQMIAHATPGDTAATLAAGMLLGALVLAVGVAATMRDKASKGKAQTRKVVRR